jgi:hypothetical protein
VPFADYYELGEPVDGAASPPRDERAASSHRVAQAEVIDIIAVEQEGGTRPETTPPWSTTPSRRRRRPSRSV